MPFDIKPWDKEISIPSLFFIIYITIILYIIGYGLKIIWVGTIAFFVPFILFLLSNDPEYGRKIRTFLSRKAYYNADRKLKNYFKTIPDRPLKRLYDKKLDSHLRGEIDKLDLRVVLYSNLALVSILIIFINLFSSIIIFTTKIDIKLFLNFGFLLLAIITFKISIKNCKKSTEEITYIYIEHIKRGKPR